jgi:hypothetical protein
VHGRRSAPQPSSDRLRAHSCWARRAAPAHHQSGRPACRDLLRLRLKTAEAYVKVLTGQSAGENGVGAANRHLGLTAAVIGLGPHFRLQLKVSSCCACRADMRWSAALHCCDFRCAARWHRGELCARSLAMNLAGNSNALGAMQVTNRSKEALKGFIMCMSANHELYHLASHVVQVPMLVPGLQYPLNVDFTCIAPESGACGEMTAVLMQHGSTETLASAQVAVPVSEADEVYYS